MRRRWLGRIVGAAGFVAAVSWAWAAAEDAGWFDAKAVPVPDDVARAMLRDVKRWGAATSGERRGVAERVERALRAESVNGVESATGADPVWTLLRVRPFGFEGHRHEIAAFRHERTGLEFSLIPGGTFTMGSPESEAHRDDDETQHEVTLERAFLLGRTECTQEAYERVAGANPAVYAGLDRPVEMVSWDDATGFCAKAGLRLPSEAEWEFACRAGTTSAYWSGDTEADLARAGWDERNLDRMPTWLRWARDKAGRKPFLPGTQAVALLSANPFGLHDVHGNVWEWCADTRHDGYVGAPTDGGAWVNDGAVARALRGGSWFYPFVFLRCAARTFGDPGNRSFNVGFRPARSVPEE